MNEKYFKYFYIGVLFIIFTAITILLSPKFYNIVVIKDTVLFIGMAVIFILTAAGLYLGKIKLTLSQFDLPFGIFLIINIISFIFSSSKFYSFYYLSVLVSYFIVFFYIRIVFDGKKFLKHFLIIIISITLFISFYGILLQNGTDILKYYGDLSSITRTPSTMGNPNFFAGFLIIVFLIIVSSIFYFKKNYMKLFSGITAGLVLYSILLTRTRAAFIGLAVGIMIFTALLIFKFLWDKELMKRFPSFFKYLGTSVVVLLVLIVLISPRGYWKRLTAATNLKAISTTMFRIYTWKSTLKIIKDNPILGSGVGTFRVEYPSRKSKRIFMFEEHHNAETIHAHNEFLEVASDSGILGVIGFLWILLTLVFIFFRIIIKLKSVQDYILLLGTFASIFASLANNFFSVNMRYTSSGFAFWIVLGFFFAILLPIITENKNIKRSILLPVISKNKNILKFENLSKILSVSLLIISLIWSAIIIPFAIRNYKSDEVLKLAVEYSKGGVSMNMQGKVLSAIFYYKKARDYYLESLKFQKNNVIANYFMGNLCQDLASLVRNKRRIENDKAKIKLEMKRLQALARKETSNSYKHRELENNIKKLREAIRKADEDIASIGSSKKLYESAVKYYDIVIGNSPNYVQVHYHKGRALKELRLYKEAKQEFEFYRKQNPVDFESYFILADLYEKLGDKDKVIGLRQELLTEINADLELFPSYLPLYFSLFKIYVNEKNNKKAEESLLRIFELPDIHHKKSFRQAIRLLYAFYFRTKQQEKIVEFRKKYLLNSSKIN